MRVRSKSALMALAIVWPTVTGPAPRAQERDPAALPYHAQMLRLSEIIGAVHFLKQLCDGAGSSPWRNEMAALLESERPDGERRARMIDAFNRSYRSYRSVYRACGAGAQLVLQRYRDEGMRIAFEIGAQYGNTDGE